MMSVHVDVRDPPSALRPPLAEFVETLKHEGLFQATSLAALESSEAYSFAKFPRPAKVSMIPRLATAVENIATVDVSHGKAFDPPAAQEKTVGPRSSVTAAKPKLLRKRRSLQSIFVPSFLHTPPAATGPITAPPSSFSRARSQSAPRQPSSSTLPIVKSKATSYISSSRSESPSRFFIDDDPFASISIPSVTSLQQALPTRSSLSPTTSAAPEPVKQIETSTQPPPPLPLSATYTRPTDPRRPKSSGNGQARGALMKPAFTSRPSLPSLHTLAQMNVVIPKKTRKGTVGARLPYEPWNMDLSELNPRTPRSPSTTPSATTHKPKVGSVSDFTLNLGGDAPDFASTLSVDEEDDSELYGSSLHEYTDGDSPPSLSYTPSNPSLHSLSRSSSLTSVSSSGLQPIDSMNSFLSGSVSDLSEPTNDRDTERFQDQDPLQSEPDFDYYWEPSADLTLDPLESKSQLRSRSRSPSTWVDVGRTPHQSLYDNTSLHALDDTSFKPGTSASTIRSSLHNAMGSARFGSSLLSEKRSFEEEVVDGSEWEGRRGNGHHGDQDRKRGDNRGGGGGGGREGTYNGNNFGAGGGGGGRDRDRDDRRDRQRNIATSFSTPSESDDDQDEETDASTDDYGVDSASSSALTSALRHPVDSISDSPSGTSTGTDDDVPLAQRIPTALTAQKTIRKQVRDERDRRRKERAADRSGSAARQWQTISPAGTSTSGTGMALSGTVSSSQKVALHSSRSMGRVRTKTMPSNTNSPFAIDDLTKKLLTVQAAGSPPAALLQTRLPPDRELGANNDELARRLLSFQAAVSPVAVTTALRPSSSQGNKATAMSQPPFTQSRPSADNGSRGTGLRAMRSLHGLASKAAEGYSVATTEASSDQRLGRSVTTGRSRRVDDVFLNVKSGPIPPSNFDGRVSTDKPRPHRTSEDTAQQSAGGYALASADYESSAPLKSGSRPRIPPLPAAEVLSNIVQSSGLKSQLASQRIFIENKQRFNMVEIGPLTNAGEVVHMVASQAALEKLAAGSGGWMLWEVAQDFGMERPIREYELLSDVESSWNKDKLVNIFVIKKTPLAPLLSRSAIPPSSPKHRGYIEWESKKGRWNKRWMELREHSLWLSKRDSGKDETFLCSLSNFDVYYVSKYHRAPKPFVFAVKSADKLSLFENTSDYVHFFSCGEKDGETWMQAILLARSYVLYQERNILFAAKPSAGGSTPAAAKSLSRSGSRKQSSAQRSTQPIPPFVSMSAPATPPANAVFEPGSLLAKRRNI